MGRRVGSWVLLAVSFLFGCASSAGAGEGQGRPARPRRRDRDATRDDANRENDTRAAIGLSHGEALASHRELRGLFDLRTAPSARIANALYSGLYDYTDRMLFEIVDARRARYGKKAR